MLSSSRNADVWQAHSATGILRGAATFKLGASKNWDVTGVALTCYTSPAAR
jgi:hypothetical protein